MDSATKLSEVLDSPRAAKALERAGFKTVGDLEGVALEAIAGLNGVGQRTLEQIQTVHQEPEKEDFGAVEEGGHDVHLLSPRPKYVIWVLRGDRILDPSRGTSRVMPPVLIQFRDGRGKITRDQYLARKYNRDAGLIAKHIEDKKPWRAECVEWLRSRVKHGREYTVMSD